MSKNRKKRRAYVEGDIYDNCLLEAPDGEPLARCALKKANWYLDRDLGTVVNHDPFTVRLNFEPEARTPTDEQYCLAHKENICVVCGIAEKLTKHHCVPYVFRKNFPPNHKSHLSHDVVILCVPCHNKYEHKAGEFKKEIAREYGLDPDYSTPSVIGVPRLLKARGAANALKRHSDRMPPDRREELHNVLVEYFGRESITDEDIRLASKIECKIPNKDYVPQGALLVSKIKNIEKFVKRWRTHFIDSMQPKYLPDRWSVDYKVKSRTRKTRR